MGVIPATADEGAEFVEDFVEGVLVGEVSVLTEDPRHCFDEEAGGRAFGGGLVERRLAYMVTACWRRRVLASTDGSVEAGVRSLRQRLLR